MELEQLDGVVHEPTGDPRGVVLLTHGAGGNRDSPLLIQLCDEWASRGWTAIRYNLPYRRRRPKGPPSGSAASDQAGIAEAIAYARELTDGPVIAGGHSYGGRMTSAVIAGAAQPGTAGHRSGTAVIASTAQPGADLLALSSYPLHPPGKPERARTEHLPQISVPVVFTHGSKDPFGSIDEVRAAAALIPSATEIVEITGARHDLGSKTLNVPALAVDAALRLLPSR